ncbi:MAG: AAC(3) family N-acetyltransferase, partial [Candidatus Bipolaricaulis sp.]|nr:AAC(3) family N-acetyltransferase [Candidatus Bipolaricaulis sp.]
FAACGPRANEIVGDHGLDYSLGERSPLARIYDLDGTVLLLGVGHEGNTSIHLAEYRAEYPGKQDTKNGAPVLVGGTRAWVPIVDVAIDSSDFERIGTAYAKVPGRVHCRSVGAGVGLWMKQRPLVDFAAQWIPMNRRLPPVDDGIRVRALGAQDREEWGRLRAALWPCHRRDELEREMEEMPTRPDREGVFVAEFGKSALCGMVEASLRPRAKGCSTSPVGYIEGWYVDPAWRRRGVGRRLVEAAEAWARARGCTEMASDTTSDYPASAAAHRAVGYAATSTCLQFRKGLRP